MAIQMTLCDSPGDGIRRGHLRCWGWPSRDLACPPSYRDNESEDRAPRERRPGRRGTCPGTQRGHQRRARLLRPHRHPPPSPRADPATSGPVGAARWTLSTSRAALGTQQRLADLVRGDAAPLPSCGRELCQLESEQWTPTPEMGLPPLYLDPFIGGDVEIALWQGSPPTKFGMVYRDRLEASSQIQVIIGATATEVLSDESGQHGHRRQSCQPRWQRVHCQSAARWCSPQEHWSPPACSWPPISVIRAGLAQRERCRRPLLHGAPAPRLRPNRAIPAGHERPPRACLDRQGLRWRPRPASHAASRRGDEGRIHDQPGAPAVRATAQLLNPPAHG